MSRFPDTPFLLDGGCLCRAVRYTIHVPKATERPIAQDVSPSNTNDGSSESPRMPLVSWCHCTSCRVGSGGLLASWLGAPQSWVTFTTRGLDDITQQHAVKDVVLGSQAVKGTSIGVYSHTSGNFRTFCTRCGSSLTFAEEEAECSRGMGALVDIATGTLDNASLDRVRADRHTWWSDGREWIMDICHRGDEKSLKHVKGTMSEDVERAAQNKR